MESSSMVSCSLEIISNDEFITILPQIFVEVLFNKFFSYWGFLWSHCIVPLSSSPPFFFSFISNKSMVYNLAGDGRRMWRVSLCPIGVFIAALFSSTHLRSSANLSYWMFFRNGLLCFIQEKELLAFRMREVHKTFFSLFYFSFFLIF